MSQPEAPAPRPRRRVTRFLLTGVAVLLPVFLTGYVVYFLCRFVDDVLGRWLGRQFAALLGLPPADSAARATGAILAVIGVVILAGLAGAVVRSLIGKRLLGALQYLLFRIPIIRAIYPSVKQVTDFFFSEKKPQFHSVVAVPFPCQGVYSIAFVTGQGMRSLNAARGEELVQVFVPFAPAPVTGYVVFVPRREVIEMPITVEEAFQLLISGGVIVPPKEAVGGPAAGGTTGTTRATGT